MGWSVPSNAKELRQLFCQAILREWSVPSIEPIFEDYEYDNGKSAFRVDAFGSVYEISIKQVG